MPRPTQAPLEVVLLDDGMQVSQPNDINAVDDSSQSNSGGGLSMGAMIAAAATHTPPLMQ